MIGMRNTVNPNIERELAHSPEISRAMYGYAVRAAAEARKVVGGGHGRRLGYYQRSIFAGRGVGGTAIYGASDFKAWWVEFGAAGHNPPRHPLITAARRLGMRLDLTRGP